MTLIDEAPPQGQGLVQDNFEMTSTAAAGKSSSLQVSHVAIHVCLSFFPTDTSQSFSIDENFVDN